MIKNYHNLVNVVFECPPITILGRYYNTYLGTWWIRCKFLRGHDLYIMLKSSAFIQLGVQFWRGRNVSAQNSSLDFNFFSICRGVVRNFNLWVPKVCYLWIWPDKIILYSYEIFFSSKSVGSILYFSKIHGFRGTHANYAPVVLKIVAF